MNNTDSKVTLYFIYCNISKNANIIYWYERYDETTVTVQIQDCLPL